MKPNELSSLAALLAAERTTMGKTKGERDTEFVKRIAAAYLSAKEEIDRERNRSVAEPPSLSRQLSNFEM